MPPVDLTVAVFLIIAIPVTVIILRKWQDSGPTKNSILLWIFIGNIFIAIEYSFRFYSPGIFSSEVVVFSGFPSAIALGAVFAAIFEGIWLVWR